MFEKSAPVLSHMSQINGILLCFPFSVEIMNYKLQIACYTCHIFHIPNATSTVCFSNSCSFLADLSQSISKPLHYMVLVSSAFLNLTQMPRCVIAGKWKTVLGLTAHYIIKVHGRVEIYPWIVNLKTRWKSVSQHHAPANLLPMKKSHIAISSRWIQHTTGHPTHSPIIWSLNRNVHSNCCENPFPYSYI
jgi:hypothetical protein